ncbi:formylglycine-generating enzyme required for sulfatase activity [Pseudonocardia kunmingensis]|uniref:Formylglycine-generating enzyme required for sulfatase activity n=1 Tax=Pseudonocardia kunmingensis TaxID=630975 RepID=A0A543DWR1_9PSEU|nr:formylglycine-generating enzyme required for sulfatase activity [Pseudonocardia kunmingensis]
MESVPSSSCCPPARGSVTPLDPVRPPVPARGAAAPSGGFVALPGGVFAMGSEDRDAVAGDGEGPVAPVRVRPFAIATCAVSNDEFAVFVEDTGYVTEAERFGWSFVFAGFLPGTLRGASPRPEGTPWWCGVQGAWWRSPEGPGSDLDGRGDHPVVHVSWHDADAYARWAGGRLPTEAEWEYAARGGLSGARFAWGDELTPGGEHRCNIWQGRFPTRNTAEDGYAGTAPVDAFPPNGYGLHNVAGNVWEWCADWWATEHARTPGGEPVTDPRGPDRGTAKLMRGGSYLCHDSYCNRYRVAARTSNSPDSSSGNQGFRIARDA